MLLLLFYLNVTVVESLKRGHSWVQRMCPLRNERCRGWDHDEVFSYWRWQEVSTSERHPPAGGICRRKAFTCGRHLPAEGIHLREVPACGSVHLKGGEATGVAAHLGAPLWEVPACRDCPLSGAEDVRLWELRLPVAVSACGRCLLPLLTFSRAAGVLVENLKN